MEKNRLNLVWLYPDMLNLHGDRGNVQAFEKIAKILDLEINIQKIDDYASNIDFENADIILVNPGELKVIKAVIESLKKQAKNLDEYIQKNKFIILIGTSGAIMSKKIKRLDGTEIEGLGYLNMDCTQREYIHGDDIYFELDDSTHTEIIGSQIQIIDTKLNENIALATTKYGLGNNGDGTEGAKYKNVIFTNGLGPIFVKNPWWTEKIIKEAMKNKGVEITSNIDKSVFEIELNSNESIKNFINSKIKN